MAKKRARQTSLGFLLWIALILLLIVIVLFNRKTIIEVVKEFNNNPKGDNREIVVTDLQENSENNNAANQSNDSTSRDYNNNQLQNNNTRSDDKMASKTNNSSSELNKNHTSQTDSQTSNSNQQTSVSNRLNNSENSAFQVDENPKPAKIIQGKAKKVSAKEKELLRLADNPVKDQLKTRKFRIYYLHPTDSEPLKLQGIERQITFNASPLKSTLIELFNGIKASEFNRYSELTNTIPEGSEIQSIKVVNGVALISLNESFTINPFSKEGLEASLKQIVFTATEFPTVNSVQILINETKQDYLGAEGGYIGSPLRRNSF